MSAGQPSSDPNFWDRSGTKAICIGGSGAVGGSQMHHNHQENKHKKIMRGLERVEKLNNRSITPKQYVKYASQDNVPTDEITEELVEWGDKWKGTDFSDPEAFSINEKWITSRNLARRFMRLKDRSCQLDVHKSESSQHKSESESSSFDASAPIAEDSVLTTEQKGTPKHLGRRGGSIELMEVAENGLEMSTQRSPNLVSAEQVQAVSDRPVLRSYTFVSPGEINPIFYYLFGVFFVFATSVVVDYFQQKVSKWIKSASSTQEHCSVEKPQLLLDIFTAYQNKTISKKKVIYILVNFYDLSEVEALDLLDE
jgi:hypothetical protein